MLKVKTLYFYPMGNNNIDEELTEFLKNKIFVAMAVHTNKLYYNYVIIYKEIEN